MAQVYVIGRVTSDLELKTSVNKNPYVRFDFAERIDNKACIRTQYLQVCAMGGDAERIVHANVKKGSLIWVSGSLELEEFTKKDGITTDKRLKVLLDNWGFVPITANRAEASVPTDEAPEMIMQKVEIIDGERETLPE